MPDFNMDTEFSELAHAALQAKMPSLMTFVVGFQTVHASPDNTRALGMFGLDVGSRLFFVPVFFLKGSLKPLSLIFDYAGNQFMPFEDDWVQHILKSDKYSLGTPSVDPRAGYSNFLSPSTDAVGSAGMRKNASETFKVPELETFTKSRPKHRVASYMPSFLEKASSETLRAFVGMLRDPEFAQIVDKKIGLDLVKQAMSKSKKIVDGVEDESGVPATEDGGVAVVTVDERKNNKAILDKMTADDKKGLMMKGYYVSDQRADSTAAYNTQFKSQFFNPTKSGEYTTILEDGTLQNVIVIYKPHAISSNTSENTCLVIDPRNMRFCEKPPQDFMVSSVRRPEDLMGMLLSKTLSAKAMKLGEDYMLVTPDLRKCSDKFRVETRRDTEDGRTQYKVCPSSSYSKTYILVGLSGAENFKAIGNETIVPGKAVALPLPRFQPNEDLSFEERTKARREHELVLGSVGDLSNKLLHTGLEPLVLKYDGVEFNVGNATQKLDKTAALKSLILDYGFNEGDTLSLLKQASKENEVSVLIKRANPTPVNQVEMSDQPEALVPSPEPATQVPEITSAPQYSYEDPFKSNPELNAGAPTPALSMRSAKFDTNIFDASILESLASSVAPNEAILEYLPDLEIALDKLGRMLFLFWWKYDTFKDSFTSAELADTEEDLKILLSKLGNVALRFKRKILSLR